MQGHTTYNKRVRAVWGGGTGEAMLEVHLHRAKLPCTVLKYDLYSGTIQTG